MGGRSDSGGGVLGVLGLLLLLGLVIKYIWWIVGVTAAAALIYGVVWWAKKIGAERAEAEELARRRADELKIRADRQHRWDLIGDSRAVYGPEGAEVMRRVTQDGDGDGDADFDDEDAPVARLARTPAELDVLRGREQREWKWALFASILWQRRQALLPRLRDSAVGFVPSTTVRAYSGRDLASRLSGLLSDMFEIMGQLDALFSAPEFIGVLADRQPAADAVEHLADRVMDYHLRLLELSEECRGISAPAGCSDAVRDCARVLHEPLEAIRLFIEELAELVDALPSLLEHATGAIDLGGITLELRLDETRFDRLRRRLDELASP